MVMSETANPFPPSPAHPSAHPIKTLFLHDIKNQRGKKKILMKVGHSPAPKPKFTSRRYVLYNT